MAYHGLGAEVPPGQATLYYDPILDVHHRLPQYTSLVNNFYLAPQVPDEARELFMLATSALGMDRPDVELPLPRVAAVAQFLAREWSMSELDANLTSVIEATYEPTWEVERGEFRWGLGLREDHPRGQYNAFLAAAEAVAPGAWERMATVAFREVPQVVGVDFPRVAMRRAVWRDGVLELTLAPLSDRVRPGSTSFAVVGLNQPTRWVVRSTGDVASCRVDGDRLVMTAPEAASDLQLVRS